MFFLQGRVEMILCDVRARFAAARHAILHRWRQSSRQQQCGSGRFHPASRTRFASKGAEDVIMVYGTSTIFHPEFEGRIASEIESAELPESWQKFLGRDD